MTLKELSQLYYLNREIEDLKIKISELEDKATDTSAKITGMPHGCGGAGLLQGKAYESARTVPHRADPAQRLHIRLPRQPYAADTHLPFCERAFVESGGGERRRLNDL